MVNQAYPSLNDFEPSWADIQLTFTVNGGGLALGMTDIAGLKWGRKVEVGEKRGASGGRVMARTTGQGSQEASATLYRPGLRALTKALANAPNIQTRGNQLLIGLVSFDIDIFHSPPGEVEVYHTRIKGCRYLGESDDMKEGFDPDKVEINLNPIEIANIINGSEIVLL
jgi:hypothetical protein